ncbi:hypothetical protein DICVIV_01775 [Dictyocaulus viviparus]|uniref:Uncharacterized protein n=1 Tax=Dictyocaulus viviparus TaxID=29172 RepID=A0A0D8Y5B8_DICVI|nr:hypothetical protein DICVIV_01775 [Dictyocaulus viviparus]
MILFQKMSTSEKSATISDKKDDSKSSGKVHSPLLCELLKQTHKRAFNDSSHHVSTIPNDTKVGKVPINASTYNHGKAAESTSGLRELLATPCKQLKYGNPSINSAVVNHHVASEETNSTIRHLLSLPRLDARREMRSNLATKIEMKENLPMQSITHKVDQIRSMTMPRHYPTDSATMTELKLHQAYKLHKFAKGIVASKTSTQ